MVYEEKTLDVEIMLFIIFMHSGVQHSLTIRVTWRVSNKKQDLLTLH